MIDPNKPTDNALQFTEMYMQGAFALLDTQKANATATSEALNALRSALSDFSTALAALTGAGGITQMQGLLSNPALGNVSVGAGAQAGSYSFFVEQLATAHQLSVGGLPSVPVAGAGSLSVDLGNGDSFDVDLSAAKPDENGNLSPAELARAINEAADNRGKVSASVVTVNGEQQLVLTSGQTGTDGKISLDTSNIGNADLRNALDGASEMTAAQNAVFYVGGEGGTRVEQSSNTFTGIDGVSVTFTQAMSVGDPALTLTVGRDDSATEAKVQAFVDAYNAAMKAIGDLAYAGDGTPGSAGPMSGDAGVRALQQRMNDMLRQSVGDKKLLDFGISADRDGVLSLDSAKLERAMAADPSALDKLFGDGETGLLGKFDSYLDSWLSGTGGQLKSREDSLGKIQSALSKRETELGDQYNRVYQRYVKQFTRLQAISNEMNSTMDMLKSLFMSSDKS